MTSVDVVAPSTVSGDFTSSSHRYGSSTTVPKKVSRTICGGATGGVAANAVLARVKGRMEDNTRFQFNIGDLGMAGPDRGK